MEDPIKTEVLDDAIQCRTCLSINRELKPLGELTTIFRRLFHEYEEIFNIGTLEICCDCKAALDKIDEFYNSVERATKALFKAQEEIYNDEFDKKIEENYEFDNKIEENDEFDNKIEENDGPSELSKSENEQHSFKEESSDDYEVPIDPPKKPKVEIKAKIEETPPRKYAKQKVKYVMLDEQHSVTFKKINFDNNQLNLYLDSVRCSDSFNKLKFKCKSCAVVFRSVRDMHSHKRAHHNNLCSFVCDICQSRFGDKINLSAHITRHFDIYECQKCKHICRGDSARDSHAKEHSRILQCLYCDAKFCTIDSRQQQRLGFFEHYRKYHTIFKCDHCSVSFKTRRRIECHMRSKHIPRKCSHCDKMFASYYFMSRHKVLFHSKPTGPAYCVECDEHFDDDMKFKRHLTTVRHKPVKKKRIPCTACDKVFSKNTYLKNHYDLVHLNKFKFRCEECDKNFVRKYHLTNHIKRIHEGIKLPKNKMCNICGRGFTDKTILVNHIRTHTGERPYSCDTCSSSFAQKTALDSHIKSIHNKKRIK